MSTLPKLLIASTNIKKAAEMRGILISASLNADIITLADLPYMADVEETGATFMENAHLKAKAAVEWSGLISIADDGGLIIDALDGAPGVHSHRFLGENTSFTQKMTHILETMADVVDEKRTCRFYCAVVIAAPGGETFECSGVCEGRIGRNIHGSHGFGYDPIFLLPELGLHMSELPPESKRLVSHRGKALDCATLILRRLLL